MVKRYKGGLMSGTEAVTSISDARGMWGTVQATQARNTGNWPALLATETAGPGSGAGFANGFMTVSNVSVTDSNYTVLNDTPNISTSGGYIKITGRGFVSGCVVYVGGVAATSTTFISSTEVRAQIAAATSNTLMVYVVNPDGSTGIKLNSLVFSGTPTWVTGTTLTSQVTDVVFSISFSATSDSAVTYLLNTGSSLPPGTSLFANGLFTGTVTGLSSDTTYSFSVLANDAENQDTARTFNVTFGIGDSGFYLTPVLMNAEGNLWIKDSSNNGFTSTVAGDSRPTAFSPYNSSWSGFFDGTGDYLDVSGSSNLAFGTNDFTIEFFAYIVALNTFMMFYDSRTAEGLYPAIYKHSDNTIRYYVNSGQAIAGPALAANTWYHIVVSRVSGITRMFVNGTQVVSTYTDTNNYLNGAGRPRIGANGTDAASGVNGYISNLRVLNGTGYTSVTIPTSKLTAIANTQLLTLQDNRFKDNSTNAYTITKTNDAATKSFGPFAETDTFSGSGYFDGTGDYLTSAYNTTFGSGDFTVECWLYMSVVTNTYSSTVIGTTNYNGVATRGWSLEISSSGYPVFTLYNTAGTGATTTSSTVLPANQWTHLAAVRSGTTITIYMNGASIVSGTNATSDNYSSSIYIATNSTSFAIGVSTYSYAGYISNARIVVGVAGYTGNFTPQTSSLSTTQSSSTNVAAISSSTSTSLLTLQYRVGENSHRFVDEAGLKYMITRTGEVHQGSFSPFSPAGWSAYFDGTGDYLTLPSSSEFNFGTGDFSIEVWIYLNATPTGNQIFEARSSDTLGAYAIGVTASSKLDFLYSASRVTSATSVSVNTWTHIAVVRASGTIKLYINGVADTNTASYASAIDTNGVPVIGGGRASGTSSITGYYFNGYISNFRIVKGLAVYTGNFTLPTNILGNTQTSGSNISAITSGSTFLSLQNNRFIDNGVNAFTITRNGDARIHAFSPFRASGAYNPVLYGGSAYFDGSGDYLDVTGSTGVAFGTGDWTIEFWLYTENLSGDKILYDARPASTQGAYPTIYQSTNTIKYYTSSADRITSSTTITATTWNHIAVARVSGTTRMYINGIVQTTTYTDSTTYLNGTSRPRLGDSGVTAGAGFNGFISGLRVVNGQGIFTGNFTVPTAPPGLTQTLSTNVAAMTSNVTLLTNFTYSGVIDHTGRNNIYTFTGTNIRSSNVQSKFGGGSIFFTGGYQYLFIGPGNNSTYPPLLPTIGDYTVEFWVYATASDTTLMCLNTTLSVYAACRLQVNANGSVGFLVSTSSPNVINIATGAGTFAYNTWQHIAVVRNGGTHTVYINGTNRASSTTIAAATAVQGGVESVLGCIDNRNNSDFASFFQGYIDDFRVTRYARYTADFTPPTTAFLTR